VAEGCATTTTCLRALLQTYNPITTATATTAATMMMTVEVGSLEGVFWVAFSNGTLLGVGRPRISEDSFWSAFRYVRDSAVVWPAASWPRLSV